MANKSISLNEEERVKKVLRNIIGKSDQHCEGFGLNSGSNNYIMGVNIAVAKSLTQFTHEGSCVLDQINAFDLAETESAYLGQINMIEVSSFCGINGIIWGYHVARPDNLYTKYNFVEKVEHKNKVVSVYSAIPLIEALIRLFGTVDNRRFNLLPGSHVPCATKNVKSNKESCIFVAIGVGIPVDSTKVACLMMEDVGLIEDNNISKEDFGNNFKPKIINNISRSIIQVGINQHIDFKEIFCAAYSININSGEIGCALVACPYFHLAKNTILNNNVELLVDLSLNEWEDQIFKK